MRAFYARLRGLRTRYGFIRGTKKHARRFAIAEDPPLGQADRADRRRAPSAAEIETLLTVASRVPDHGKLTPWRFIVFEGEARLAAGEAIARAFRAKYPDAKPEQVEFERTRLARAPLVIAVVSRAGPHVKIPEWEQVLSAGAAAMSLVLAAHALGYAASWITEWYAYDRARARCARARRENERIAGFVHIGRPAQAARGPAAAAARRDRHPLRRLSDKHRMFYDTRKNDHGLPHDPFKAIVAPRPIGWITSMSAKGEINLAPYSFFNGVVRRSADRDVLQRGPQGLARLRRGDQGIRLQSRDLRPARRDERDLGATFRAASTRWRKPA